MYYVLHSHRPERDTVVVCVFALWKFIKRRCLLRLGEKVHLARCEATRKQLLSLLILTIRKRIKNYSCVRLTLAAAWRTAEERDTHNTNRVKTNCAHGHTRTVGGVTGAVRERGSVSPGPDAGWADGRKSSVRRAKGFLCSRSNNGSYLPSGPLAVTIFPSLWPYLCVILV